MYSGWVRGRLTNGSMSSSSDDRNGATDRRRAPRSVSVCPRDDERGETGAVLQFRTCMRRGRVERFEEQAGLFLLGA